MQSTSHIIENKLEDFGLENINERTVVCVNKADLADVSVFDSEFNTFTEAHAISAQHLVTHGLEFDGSTSINYHSLREFVENKCLTIEPTWTNI